jgi:hypothetical protein
LPVPSGSQARAAETPASLARIPGNEQDALVVQPAGLMAVAS